MIHSDLLLIFSRLFNSSTRAPFVAYSHTFDLRSRTTTSHIAKLSTRKSSIRPTSAKANWRAFLRSDQSLYVNDWNIHSYPRMSLVRCHSPSMLGHHRLATHTCPSQDISSMVCATAGSCIQSSLLSLHCLAAILVLTLAMQLCALSIVMVCRERFVLFFCTCK